MRHVRPRTEVGMDRTLGLGDGAPRHLYREAQPRHEARGGQLLDADAAPVGQPGVRRHQRQERDDRGTHERGRRRQRRRRRLRPGVGPLRRAHPVVGLCAGRDPLQPPRRPRGKRAARSLGMADPLRLLCHRGGIRLPVGALSKPPDRHQPRLLRGRRREPLPDRLPGPLRKIQRGQRFRGHLQRLPRQPRGTGGPGGRRLLEDQGGATVPERRGGKQKPNQTKPRNVELGESRRGKDSTSRGEPWKETQCGVSSSSSSIYNIIFILSK
mmetsp:Transcript_9574/g.22598  ORF Transcript_9574/g.22598 Transcript_9574/m.22598 type:complete len:269 (-) Transcript_9574:8-814(-)